MSLANILYSLSHATCLLQENHNDEAIEILALDVKPAIADILTAPVTSGCLREIQGRSFEEVCYVYPIETSPVKGELNVSPDNKFCFYPKAFEVHLLDHDVSASFLANQLTGIAMYNLALAYHREGIQRGSSKHMCQALSLYRVAISSLRQCSGSATEVTLMLAAANNMGHIYSLYFEFEGVRHCENLVTTLLDTFPGECDEELDGELLSYFVEKSFFSSFQLTCAPSA